MIKVCQITSVHPPLDIRVFYKMSKSLAKAGYDVTLIATNPELEVIEGVRIVPFPVYKNRFKRLLLSPFKMFSLAMKEKAAIYHFHDPELMVTGFLLKLCGKKVIYDVHEDYTKEIFDKYWLKYRSLRKIVSLIYKCIEILFTRLCITKVVAVTTDIAAKFPRKKTVVVKNFADLELIASAKPKAEKKEKPIIIYVGGLYRAKGILETVQAIGLTQGKAELWLLGKWGEPGLKEECMRTDGWRYTRYKGVFKPEEVYSYLKIADIAISTQYPVDNFLTALPVKFFEYMACSLPMIISAFPFWVEMFGQCTLFVDPYKPGEIADKIRYLLENPEKGRELGQKGYRLVAEKYNWKSEEKKLLSVYNEMLKSKKNIKIKEPEKIEV